MEVRDLLTKTSKAIQTTENLDVILDIIMFLVLLELLLIFSIIIEMSAATHYSTIRNNFVSNEVE